MTPGSPVPAPSTSAFYSFFPFSSSKHRGRNQKKPLYLNNLVSSPE